MVISSTDMLHSTTVLGTQRRYDADIVLSVRLRVIVFVFLFPLLCAKPACTYSAPVPIPTVTAIVVSRIGWDEFEKLDLPNIDWLKENGSVGLLSPGLPRLPSAEDDNWASFTAGDVINTKNEHIGLLERQLAANVPYGKVEIDHQLLVDSFAPNRFAWIDDRIAQWRKYRSSRSVLIFCSITDEQQVSPDNRDAVIWDELTPAVICGPGFASGDSLTSATTRTKGLIALRDLAPTILFLAGSPIPDSMTGAPARQIVVPDRDKTLSRMNTVTRLGELAIVPLGWFLGISALLAICGGIWATERPFLTQSGDVVCYMLRLVLCAPLTMLLTPCLPINNLTVYVAALIGIDLLLASIPSVIVVVSVTVLVILGDGVTGTTMIASSVISGYWLSGIRFYGIGNEYMGVLISMALIAPPLLRQNAFKKLSASGFALVTAVIYITVIFVLSYPGFGAKAGGAVSSLAALGPAWYAITFHKRPTWVAMMVGVVCGFGLVFLLAALAQRMHAPPSHIQAAVSAVHQGRLGYIKHIAIRKAKMAVKTVLTPGGIVGILGLLPVLIYWRNSRLSDQVRDYLATKFELAAAVTAGFWALIATLLFNDSGSVAFLFFFGAMSLIILHELVKSKCAYSR